MTLHIRHKRLPSSSTLMAALIAAVLVINTFMFGISSAQAESLEDLQAKVEQTNTDYEAANKRVDELQTQIAENESRIAEIQNQLPAQRLKAADSIRAMYRMQQGSMGIIDLILSTDNFNDLIAVIQYLEIIQNKNSDAINTLVSLSKEISDTQASLNAQMAEAEAQKKAAEDAMNEAIASREALQKEQEQKAAAEAAAAEAALKEASQEASSTENNTFTNASGNTTEVTVPSTPSAPNVDWSNDKTNFVSSWGARINAYLSGSPLAGHGETFAEAAWTYGVDPRFSPAISAVESTKGAYCFLPYNAWGWGSSSWSSWDEAIWDHTAGLASGYGGSLSVSGAAKYNPANPNGWYSSVLAQMERI